MRISGVVSKEDQIKRQESYLDKKELDQLKRAITEAENKRDMISAGDANRAAAEAAVQEAEGRLDAARRGAEDKLTPVPLHVFFNDFAAAGFSTNALPLNESQIVLLKLKGFDSATDSGAEVWTDILRSPHENPDKDGGQGAATSAASLPVPGLLNPWDSNRWLRVGLSRSATSAPEATAPEFVAVFVYNWLVLGIAGLATLLFAAFIVRLARITTLLRDNDLVGSDLIQQRTAAQSERDEAARSDAAARQLDKAVEDATIAVEAAGLKRAAATDPQAISDADAEVAKARKELEAAKNGRTAFPGTSSEHARELAKTSDTVSRLTDDIARFSADKKPNGVIGTYSLARTQVAVWVVLVLGGYLYLCFTLGHFKGLITDSILVLLGINGLAAIASIGIVGDGSMKKHASRSFFQDILGDESEPSIHRLQALAWTLVLAGIFVWNVIADFRFVDFDTKLLILLGISQSMYVGLKYQSLTEAEKNAKSETSKTNR